MSIEISTAAIADGPDVLAGIEWLFEPPGVVPRGWRTDAGLERARKTIEGGDSEVFLARDDEGRVVGVCTAYLDIESIRFGQRCWIEDLAVSPESRSEGVGAELMNAVRSWASERGATHVELDSGMARKDAHRFYERLDPSWTGVQYAWHI